MLSTVRLEIKPGPVFTLGRQFKFGGKLENIRPIITGKCFDFKQVFFFYELQEYKLSCISSLNDGL